MLYIIRCDCTSSDLLNVISLCLSYSVSFLFCVAMGFVRAEIGINPVWQVLYIGIDPGGGL